MTAEETEQLDDPYRSVEWWHDLEYPFIASTELVSRGQTFTSPLKTTDGTFTMTVMLPSPPADEADHVASHLAPPPDWRATPVETSEDWGTDYKHPAWGSAHAIVKRLAFSAEIPPEDAVPPAAREEWGVDLFSIEIRNSMEQWWDNVRTWIEISTGQRIARVGHEPPRLRGATWHESSITPIWLVSAKGNREEWRGGATELTVRPPVYGLTPELFAACLSLSEVEPDLAWTLLRDARALQDVGQYRRAVIDAATAAELAVIRLVDARLDAVEEKIRDALAEKFRMLGGKASLLKKLGNGLPKSFTDDLVEKRNDAVHDGVDPSWAECDAAIQAALAQVRRAFPLPTPPGAAEPLVCRWDPPEEIANSGLPIDRVL
ncbi:hypothetical protein [Mycobacterium sp. SA01]|uniref:hypothetical protein n=1 Tax=Mycobacterium sp. SA01 TaxID=3238820 RepID=UPI00351B5988